MTSTVEVLQKARALIEKPENWTQGSRNVRLGGTPTCANVAIGMAADDHVTQCNVANIVFRSANGLRQCDLMAIVRWNDSPGRTHAQVLAAFDKAIELAKSSNDSENMSKEGV